MPSITQTAKTNTEYTTLLDQMFEKDIEIINNTKEIAKEMPILNELCYTSMKWPVKLHYPLFEARNAFAVPNNYFQNLIIGNEKSGVSFSHYATRSIFFSNENLVIYSKTNSHKKGKTYFTSYLLAHFSKNEYSYSFEKGILAIRAKLNKKLKNLLTGKTEEKEVSFNFLHKPLVNRIMTASQAASSTQFKRVYGKYGVNKKLASSDLEGYVISVPHFSPHPYLLRFHKEFGYESNRDFQENVMDYFRKHLVLKSLSK